MDTLVFLFLFGNEIAGGIKFLLGIGVSFAIAMVNTTAFVSAFTYGEAFLAYMRSMPVLMILIILALLALGVFLNLMGYYPGFSSLLTGAIAAVVLLIMLIWQSFSSGGLMLMGEKGGSAILAYFLYILFFSAFFSPYVILSAAITSIPFAFLGYPDRLTQWASFGMFLGAASLGFWVTRVNYRNFRESLDAMGSLHEWIPFKKNLDIGNQLFRVDRATFFWVGIILLAACTIVCWLVHQRDETESCF